MGFPFGGFLAQTHCVSEILTKWNEVLRKLRLPRTSLGPSRGT
jgi:hypothetical protein